MTGDNPVGACPFGASRPTALRQACESDTHRGTGRSSAAYPGFQDNLHHCIYILSPRADYRPHASAASHQIRMQSARFLRSLRIGRSHKPQSNYPLRQKAEWNGRLDVPDENADDSIQSDYRSPHTAGQTGTDTLCSGSTAFHTR